MTKDEALNLALEVLISCELSNYGRDWVWPVTAHEQAMKGVKEAITAIKEALAQPVQPEQEVVGWPPAPWHHRILKAYPKSEPEFWTYEIRLKYMADEIAEYRAVTTPPLPVQRQPLTEIALYEAVSAIHFADNSDYEAALWSVVRALAPDIAEELKTNSSTAWHKAEARKNLAIEAAHNIGAKP